MNHYNNYNKVIEMKYNKIQKIGLMLVSIACGLSSSFTSANEYNLDLAGASPGGLWAMIGAGVNQAVKAENPKSTITYQTSGGGLANIGLLERDGASMAIIHDAELLIAKNGSAPFTAPITDLRVLAYLYTWAPMQPVISKSFAEKWKISSFEDIAKVKAPITIAINKRGNVTSQVAEKMLEAIGASIDNIESWGGRVIYAASGEQTTLMKDRRVDMFMNGLFVGHRGIMQVASSIDVSLLPLSEKTIKTVSEQTGSEPFVIPGDSYKWAPNDIPGVALGAALVVRQDMDSEVAYNLTKALFKNYKKIAGVHRAMNALTPEIMASMKVVPYHKGARRYLKEVGKL